MTTQTKTEILTLIHSLRRSKFRGSFHLNQNMQKYVEEKGLTRIKQDAKTLITKRLAPSFPKNDGRQTPMRANSHPVFIAQHATGTCCRDCLERIHHIPKGRELTDKEIEYILFIIVEWIKLDQ